MRVILAGGGTGGHVIPALAIARELESSYSAECCFIGTSRGIETRLVPAAGFPLELIEVGALNQVSLATRAKTMLGLPLALLSSLRIVRKFRPDVMIGVGGYASGPAMLAAVLRRVPPWPLSPTLFLALPIAWSPHLSRPPLFTLRKPRNISATAALPA